jgi:hypothetical protein
MRRIAALLLVLLPLGLASSCGGSGGGDTPAACTKPGTLRVIALQGQPAPDTVGNFTGFPVGLAMDVAVAGWGVFVAGTTDPAVPNGVFVVLPDGTVHLAFRQGEPVPDAAGGTISGFGSVRVNAAGQILVRVSIAGDGGGRDFGLLTAQVVGGSVTGKNDVVYESQDMSGVGLSGALQTIDESRTFFVDDGRVYFAGSTTTSEEGFWSVNVDGSNLALRIGTLSSVPPEPLGVFDLKACGVSRDGNRLAFVVDVGGQDRLYSGLASNTTYGLIAADGGGLAATPPRFGTIAEVHAGGQLLVYDSGAVLWKARGSVGSPDDVLLLGSDTVQYVALARSGDFAQQAGGGTFGTLDLIQHRAQTAGPLLDAGLVGVPNGVDSALYGLVTNPPSLAMFEGRPAPEDLGQATTFTDTDTFPGLNTPGYADVARDGGFAFAAALQNGTSGIFWLLPNCGLFTVAASGQPAPGGDTFGAFFPQATRTTHDGVVLFRAPLATAGSGIFRQGP